VALFSKKTFKRVDFIGAALLLVATTFSVAALEEAGREYAWDSAFVIAFLIIASLVWILFIIWERTTSSTSGLREPVFPWRLMGSRIWIGMVL
jgi:Kef-type K+ transport system membrane component KefB